LKPHPDLTIPMMLDLMTSGDHLPDKVGGGATDEERAAAGEELHRMATEGKVSFMCIGCEGSVPIKDAALCACGGFVCPACVALEDDDRCDHERPAFLPEEDDDDDDL
jgi:hypothetical protein